MCSNKLLNMFKKTRISKQQQKTCIYKLQLLKSLFILYIIKLFIFFFFFNSKFICYSYKNVYVYRSKPKTKCQEKYEIQF